MTFKLVFKRALQILLAAFIIACILKVFSKPGDANILFDGLSGVMHFLASILAFLLNFIFGTIAYVISIKDPFIFSVELSRIIIYIVIVILAIYAIWKKWFVGNK